MSVEVKIKETAKRNLKKIEDVARNVKVRIVNPNSRLPNYYIKDTLGRMLWQKFEGINQSAVFSSRQFAQNFIDSGKLTKGLNSGEFFFR